MSEKEAEQLVGNVVFGLPCAAEKFILEDLRAHLSEYAAMTEETLRGHLIDFLSEVAPVAEVLGLRLCCHPDDLHFRFWGCPA